MHLEAERQALLSAISPLVSVADRKSANMPILADVLLEVRKDGVATATASDLMSTLTTTISAEDAGAKSAARRPGRACVDVKRLHDLLRALPAVGVVSLDWDDVARSLTIKVGRSTFRLLGHGSLDFPELPAPPKLAAMPVVAAACLASMETVLFSASRDESRINLCGVYVETHGARTTSVTTDGHRMTVHRSGASLPPSESGRSWVLPRDAAEHAARLLSAAGKDDQVAAQVDAGFLHLRVGESSASFKLSNVVFPPYDIVMPKSYAVRVSIVRADLLAALRRAEVLAPDKSPAVALEVARDGSVRVTSDNPDAGSATQEVDGEVVDGGLPQSRKDGLRAGFNARYLIEALDSCAPAERVHVALSGELDPVAISPATPPDGVTHTCVVMPMRI